MVGLRVQTTHVPSIKRKYTVWGVSRQSSEKQEFDVEGEATGRRTKTNVAAYFRDRYNIRLRYANSFCQAEYIVLSSCYRDGCILLSHRAETDEEKLISDSVPSLGPGSAVGEKGKKRGQIGEISASEASPAMAWGGRKGSLKASATLSPLQTTSRLASLADFFSFFPQCGAWSKATLSFPLG